MIIRFLCINQEVRYDWNWMPYYWCSGHGRGRVLRKYLYVVQNTDFFSCLWIKLVFFCVFSNAFYFQFNNWLNNFHPWRWQCYWHYYRYCLISNVVFKQNFIWNVFWQEIILLFKVETIRFYGLEPSFSEVYYPVTIPISGFWYEEFDETHFHRFNAFEISSTQEVGHGSKQMVTWRCENRTVCWVWKQFDSFQFLNFCHGCSCSMGCLALSCCKRTLFRLTNAGYLRLKTSWIRSSC